jgi:single-stranded-DNA-specific exonuclease
MLIPEIEIDAEINFADITKLTDIKTVWTFWPWTWLLCFDKNIKDTGYAKN